MTTLPSDKGLTMVELMVSILLAAILSVGIYYMMTGQTQTYNVQLRNLSIQENIWGTMEYLQRQIRMAGVGFGGCPEGVIRKWDSSTHTAEPEVFALRIYNSCNIFTTSPTSCPVPPVASPTETDSLTITAINIPAGN